MISIANIIINTAVTIAFSRNAIITAHILSSMWPIRSGHARS